MTILVAGTNLAMRDRVVELLEEHDRYIARGLYEAKHLFLRCREELGAVVLSDDLAGVAGPTAYDLAAKLREMRLQAPIVLLSNAANAALLLQEHGVDNCIVCPKDALARLPQLVLGAPAAS